MLQLIHSTAFKMKPRDCITQGRPLNGGGSGPIRAILYSRQSFDRPNSGSIDVVCATEACRHSTGVTSCNPD